MLSIISCDNRRNNIKAIDLRNGDPQNRKNLKAAILWIAVRRKDWVEGWCELEVDMERERGGVLRG